jgi:hypothetical protein
VQLFSRNQTQHAIAQKFQPFVRSRSIRAGMGERATKKLAILKNVTQTRVETSR